MTSGIEEFTMLPPGQLLQERRRELNWSVSDVASKLLLSKFQIEAIEAGEHEDLAGTTYIIGYWRNYARLLGIDIKESIKAAKERLDDSSSPTIRIRDNHRQAHSHQEKSRKLTAFSFLVLAILCLAGIWFWQHPETNPFNKWRQNPVSGSSEESPAQGTTPVEPVVTALVETTDSQPQTALPEPNFLEAESGLPDSASRTQVENTAQHATESVIEVGSMTATEASADPVQAETPSIQEAEPPEQAVAPLVQAEVSPVEADAPPDQAEIPQVQADVPPDQAEIPQVQADVPPDQAEIPQVQEDDPPDQAEVPQVRTDAPSVQVEVPQVQADAPPALRIRDAESIHVGERVVDLSPVTEANRLTIHVQLRSWLDVRDKSGEKLIFRSAQSGETIELTGSPPFAVFVEFPDNVSIEYLGESVLIEPYKDNGQYARFLLGKDIDSGR